MPKFPDSDVDIELGTTCPMPEMPEVDINTCLRVLRSFRLELLGEIDELRYSEPQALAAATAGRISQLAAQIHTVHDQLILIMTMPVAEEIFRDTRTATDSGRPEAGPPED